MNPEPPPWHDLDLVLHIGSRKTGTSSIQFFLRDNRQHLTDLGCLYPRTPGRARHIRLGLSIMSKAELEQTLEWYRQKYRDPMRLRKVFRRKLFAEIRELDPPRVLLSDEALYGLSGPPLRRLRRLTAMISNHVRVVVYLRRQDDHLISDYQQVMKLGETRRLAEWAQQDMSGTYDYRGVLSTWHRQVAPTEIVVRRFEPGGFEGGSLQQDFLNAVGIDARADEMERTPNRNESLDAECVEFLRLLNIHRVENEAAVVGLIDNRELVRRLGEASNGPALTLPAAFLNEFMSRWTESNRAVALHFLRDETGQLFRVPRRSSNTTTEQRLDPARLDHFFALSDLPEHLHSPVRAVAEREAKCRP